MHMHSHARICTCTRTHIQTNVSGLGWARSPNGTTTVVNHLWVWLGPYPNGTTTVVNHLWHLAFCPSMGDPFALVLLNGSFALVVLLQVTRLAAFQLGSHVLLPSLVMILHKRTWVIIVGLAFPTISASWRSVTLHARARFRYETGKPCKFKISSTVMHRERHDM